MAVSSSTAQSDARDFSVVDWLFAFVAASMCS